MLPRRQYATDSKLHLPVIYDFPETDFRGGGGGGSIFQKEGFL